MSTFLAQFLSWRYKHPVGRGLVQCDKPTINVFVSVKKRRVAIMRRERYQILSRVTALDVYRCIILGLVGTFYGFLIFLMFV
jgi:hypothetical protein